MISCIVDGFDPWEQVETLLRRIREDMIGRCEVILVASLLLDTPPEVCRSCGEEWFGNSFRMPRNDDYSIFRARLRAQELVLCPLNKSIFKQPKVYRCMSTETTLPRADCSF